jgi:putative ABC transport system substrate-binding protein
MKRRAFIAGLGGAAAWPIVAWAQQGRKVYRLGILGVAPERNWDELLQGLQDLGYVDGQNLIVERRYSEGQAERWFDLVNELNGLKVDVIVVNTAALAAKKATSTIPIVFPAAFDLVGAGLADSLARPGGNVTGLGLLVPEVTAKGLALLKEAVPFLNKVAVLWNEPTKEMRLYGRTWRRRTYGANVSSAYRQAGNYVGRILKGVKPTAGTAADQVRASHQSQNSEGNRLNNSRCTARPR